ncbi:MAG TPA: hypothetical protein VMC43_02280 [Candidatus Paceibacterota bacterium]|nr:hypothetical protein [Candidatus Paceibacterota bacterium]
MAEDYKKTVWISTAVIAGSFLMFIFAALWLAGDLQNQSQAIVERRGTILSQSRSIALLADFKTTDPQITAYEGFFKILLPPREQLLEFSKWLDTTARMNKIAVVSDFQGDPVASGPNTPGYINFKMEMNGSYGSLQAFLSTLEFRSPRFLIHLNDLDIAKNGDSYQGTANGQVYYLDSPTQKTPSP